MQQILSTFQKCGDISREQALEMEIDLATLKESLLRADKKYDARQKSKA